MSERTLNEILHEAFSDVFGRFDDAGIKQRGINIFAMRGYGSNDFTITYGIGDYSDSDKVQGSDLSAAATEFMRRKGWTERNKPMVMISAPTSSSSDVDSTSFAVDKVTDVNDDSIPF